VPLAFSHGAGAGARSSVGTGVRRMLAATFLAISLVPLFLQIITDRQLKEDKSEKEIRERRTRPRANHRQPSVAHALPLQKGKTDDKILIAHKTAVLSGVLSGSCWQAAR